DHIRIGLAPFRQIVVCAGRTGLHRGTVNRLFKTFGQLHLGTSAALADNHLRRNIAPVNYGDFGHLIPRSWLPASTPAITGTGVGFRHGAGAERRRLPLVTYAPL